MYKKLIASLLCGATVAKAFGGVMDEYGKGIIYKAGKVLAEISIAVTSAGMALGFFRTVEEVYNHIREEIECRMDMTDDNDDNVIFEEVKDDGE